MVSMPVLNAITMTSNAVSAPNGLIAKFRQGRMIHWSRRLRDNRESAPCAMESTDVETAD